MVTLIAQVKNADRMMTYATGVSKGIEITFADGCKGVIPITDIPELGAPSELSGIELPNPYQVNIYGSKPDPIELPWDFVRHYCDSSYKDREEALGFEGMQILGKRIRARREAMKMTQSNLAAAAGIGRITVVRIENGEQSPRFETLLALANVFKISVAELLTGEIIS
jgi:DNA-binding XRE family transcriptional regulator